MKRAFVVIALIAACSGTRGASRGTEGHQAHGAPSSDTMAGMDHGAMADYAPVHVDADRAKVIGLSSVAVSEQDFTKTLRTVGVVTLDETKSEHVHAKVRGWIDGIRASYVGETIHAGDALCSIYSQDVYSSELEWLSVASSLQDAAQTKLLDAATRRLRLWDVPASELSRLAATREPSRTFPLVAPRGGVVVAKQAVDGMYVDPSLELYTLSDLSRVWVLADVYEADVPYVLVGDAATLRVEGVAQPIAATVSFLAPTFDESTRTLKARFEIDNRRRLLRPGAFVSVEMHVAMGRGLAVPESSVVRTGARAVVFVVHEHEGGLHVEPRAITLGPLVGDAYRVEAGVEAGDRVATGAQFLLDSESRLRATSAPMGAHVHH